MQGASAHAQIKALVTDFDGVHTDNSVFLDVDGREFVRCSRADGMGIEMLRRRGLKLLILSRESDGVVAARARKLQMECAHNVKDKLPFLDAWRQRNGLSWQELAYIGDDVNDLECLEACGVSAAPGNARAEVKEVCQIVLKCSGGDGALRELCDLLIDRALVPETQA
nr:HAD hydrolase family protein [uncultured Roseibium sp.]